MMIPDSLQVVCDFVTRSPGNPVVRTGLRSFVRAAAVFMLAASSSASLRAEVPGEALAKFRSGDYRAVEDALEPLFSREPVPLEALELSYTAARRDGRVFTAERRVRELIRREGERTPRWIYEGALVARDMGYTARYFDRLMFFARQQDEKTPELERALRTLSHRSVFPDAFRMYRELYGAEQARFDIGAEMLGRIRETGQVIPYLELADSLMGMAESPRESNLVIQEVFDALENRMFGLERDAVYAVLFKHSIHDLRVMRELIRRQGIDLTHLMALQRAYGRPFPSELISRLRRLDRVQPGAVRLPAAREWIEMEPIYREQAEPAIYRLYLGTVLGQPEYFIGEEDRLVSEETMVEMLRHLYSVYDSGPEQLRWLGNQAMRSSHNGTPHRFLPTEETRSELMREFPMAFDAGTLRELISDHVGERERIDAYLTLTRDRQDVRLTLLSDFARHEYHDLLEETVRREFRLNPTGFDEREIARHFLSVSGVPMETRIRVLEEGVRFSGNAGRFRSLVERGDNRARNEEEMRAFAESLAEVPEASDPLLALLIRVTTDSDLRAGNEPQPAFTAALEEAFDLYGRPFPDASVSPERTRFMGEILELYRVTARRRREGRREFARVVSPRLSAEADWEEHIEFCILDNNRDGSASLYVARAYTKRFDRWHEDFDAVWHDEEDDVFARPYFEHMEAEDVMVYLMRNRNRWSPSFLTEQLAAALAPHDVSEVRTNLAHSILDVLIENAEDAVIQNLPLDALGGQFLKPGASGAYGGDRRIRLQVMRLFVAAGRQMDGVDMLLRGAESANPVAAVNVILEITEDQNLVPQEETDAEDVARGHRRYMLVSQAGPRFAEISSDEAGGVHIPRWTFGHINWFERRGEANPDVVANLHNVEEEFIRMLSEGARTDARYRDLHPALRRSLEQAVETGDHPRAVALVLLAGRFGDDVRSGQVDQLADILETAEQYEPLLLLTRVVRDADPSAMAQLARIRNRASANVAGIFPVGEDDPRYPLFVAAQELSLNNPEQAWNLLRQNLEVFSGDPLQFPSEFVAWTLERLRNVRGEDDEFLNASLDLSHEVIARGDELPVETRARVMLNRAEIFRDQRNFDAARLEYQAIRTHPEYQQTPAGRQAMFRDVDLMIAMGNTSAAESILEFWLANPDPTLRANAHYFQALIAFQDGDDDTTRTQLERVFALDFTHTAARLLHGRWRLRTNFEVDNPEILLGDLRDRTILRPGQPLRITVQDPNLAVVGGGGSIPVIVRTSEGGDLERLSLFPSTRDPRLFRGVLDTVLGAAVPGNRVLEVNGLDVISFELDPEFLAARGMEPGEPRTLRIVDDAVLMVSAGELLTEAEQQALEIQQQMSGSRESFPEAGGAVRPGNPVYVMVRDRDQSRGGEGGSVRVTAETRSGDRIPSVILRETGPYTGVFRGEIPTALPPPHATASDSADGTLPGNTINVNRPGPWRSRTDGEQGKWLAVDTMNSHSIRQVDLITPDADSISEIRLVGRLSGDWIRLGSLPGRDLPGGGVELRTTDRNLSSLFEYRSHFSQTGDTPASLETFRYEVESRFRRIHMRGAFYLSDALSTRLFFDPLEPDENNAMRDAYVRVLVNGEVIAQGRGSDFRGGEGIPLSLAEGGHFLEIFGYIRFERDGFQLAMEMPDGQVAPFPSEWMSVADNPELERFLSDRAEITRSGEGFRARFNEPERLRALRWEFVRYTGEAVTVEEMRVENADGEVILPGETDFTDALDNDVLEIAPGDRITVSYTDQHTVSGQTRLLSRELNSRFTNGSIGFYFEQITASAQGMQSQLQRAYRFRPGDDFLVVVRDADEDVSPQADTLEVTIRTRSGETLTVTAVEQGDPDAGGVHSGRFVALVRTRLDGETGGDTLSVRPGDRITASYLDRENTNPGVPVEREAALDSVHAGEPQVTFFHTWLERREDTGADAARRLAQIRARPGNQHVGALYTWDRFAMPMAPDDATADPVTVNVDTPFPLEVYHPSAALHQGSRLLLIAAAESEIDAARREGREPAVLQRHLTLGRARSGFSMQSNPRVEAPQADMILPNAHFSGVLNFELGAASDRGGRVDGDTATLFVQGNDRVQLRIVDESRNTVYRGNLELSSEASLALLDSSFQAERTQAHLGERFFVQVIDRKQDRTPGRDRVSVAVEAELSGEQVELVLEETLPNSGVFTGVILPEFKRPEGAEAGNGEETLDPSLMGLQRIGVAFGDTLRFRYADEGGLPHRPARTHEAAGTIFEGSDGTLWAFTKQFDDPEMAVRVQFRLAESLFEMAKDYRRLDRRDRSAEVIEEGRRILEEVLMQNPETSLAVEGEYLLAHLYQEFGNESEKDDPEAAREYFQEALSRFSVLLSNHPDSEFAPRAQFQKALALEKLGDFAAAGEEYVKLTYIYPESPLVGDASIRLATHYFRHEQRFDIAGRIFSNFAERFPTHPMAARAMFMSAQSHMKQAEVWENELRAEGLSERQVKTAPVLDEYALAVASFQRLIEDGSGAVEADLRAQAMYWAGDASLRGLDYANAYIFLRRTVFEYPESEWARRARGLLLQQADLFEGLDS
ncbi:MAG: outer membrane protein assembly factor BamD [Verrucomicrobia bacterium]|nr:outer membrane protein assembly factor BamD [Verrucomicrobiota bacterium]MCH8526920.1 outer membrane protein assembly factor BamD [Kiritimatiellia bacterium]